MQQIQLARIESLIDSLGLKQLGVEPTPDSELGFRMWGGKDALGLVTRWLAKNKPGLLFSLRLSTFADGNKKFAKIDANGSIVKEDILASDIPDHNALNDLQGGNSTERYHLTLVEKNNQHVPLTLADANGPLHLNEQEISFLFGTGLQIVNGALVIKQSDIDHGSIGGLSDDDHTQYVPTSASRGFSNPVSGQFPLSGAHLATKEYVDVQASGSVDFIDAVLAISDTPPSSPVVGDRYIVNNATNWGIPLNSVVQRTSDNWEVTWNPASPGALGARVYVIAEDVDYRFVSSVWTKIQQITSHHDLLGLNADDHTQYSKVDGTRDFTGAVKGVAGSDPANLVTKSQMDTADATALHTNSTTERKTGSLTVGALDVQKVNGAAGAAVSTTATVSGKTTQTSSTSGADYADSQQHVYGSDGSEHDFQIFTDATGTHINIEQHVGGVTAITSIAVPNPGGSKTLAFVEDLPVVNLETHDTATSGLITVIPNNFLTLGTVSSITLAFDTPINGKVNNYAWRFTSGSVAALVTFPTGISWANDIEPNILANFTYEFSVVDNFGIWAQY